LEFAAAEECVRDAARRMQERNVGTLVVVDGDGQPLGILTDRDLAVRVVAEGLDGAATKVEAVMTRYPRTIPVDAPIESVVRTMRELELRRLLVVDEEQGLVGLVSIDDALGLLAAELQQLASVLVGGHPGSGLPATRSPARRLRPNAPPEGLQRAMADLEC